MTPGPTAKIPLSWKISAVMVCLVAILGVATFFLIRSKVAETLFAEHQEKGLAFARNIAANAEEPILLDNIVRLQLLLTNSIERDIIYAFITSPDKKIIAHTFPGGFPRDLLTLNQIQGNAPGHQLIKTEDDLIEDIAVPIMQGEGGDLHLGISRKALDSKLALIRDNIIGICLIVSTISMIISFFISRFITKPLSALAQGVENIGKGHLSYRVEVSSRDEIGIVAAAFNDMAEALQEDISQRLETEKALQKSTELYRSLVENIDMGVTLIDKDFNIIMANSAQGRLLQKAPAAFIGRKCFAEFEKRSAICDHCPGKRAMVRNTHQEVIVNGVRDDGSTMVARIRAFPVTDDQGAPQGFIEVVEDITVRQHLEEELQKAKKIESIGLLAGGIAHDFNNLLTGILGNISLAKIYSEGDEKVANKLNDAEHAVFRARNLTKQLLTFSKGGDPILETADIRSLLKQETTFILSGSNITSAFDIAEDLLPAQMDAGQISQVIHNICTNARQAMPAGGTITVGARNTTIPENNSWNLTAGRYVVISLSDNGPGIPPVHLAKIFDPYFSTKREGSGLGLAICYSIMAKHQGAIAVESSAESGTVFRLYLPASDKQPAAAAESDRPRHSGTGKILVMDDEEFVREPAREMLKEMGYQVALARNGEEAVSLYQNAGEAGEAFDLVILDLTIPGGMGGLATITRLLEYDPRVKAIVSSGYSNDPAMSDFRRYGFAGVIEKPYRMATLQQKLAEILG